jgi:hypothetical protein
MMYTTICYNDRIIMTLSIISMEDGVLYILYINLCIQQFQNFKNIGTMDAIIMNGKKKYNSSGHK